MTKYYQFNTWLAKNIDFLQKLRAAGVEILDDRKWSNSRSFAMLLTFGITFAVRVWLVGIVLGGWLDRRFFGDRSVAMISLVLVTVIYSFWQLYYVAVCEERKRAAQKMLQKDKGTKD